MSNTLYLTNFPPEMTEEQLLEVLAEFGEVTGLHLDMEERTRMQYALVEWASEKVATKAHRNLNGYQVEDRYLSASYPEVDPRELTAKQRKAIEDILAELEETDEIPVRQIGALARLCGMAFVEALLKEALEVAAGPGIATSDGSRPRTKGGIFFYLARYRVSPDVRKVVYNRKGKIEES